MKNFKNEIWLLFLIPDVKTKLNSGASCGVTILFFIFSKVRFSSILSFNIFSNEPKEMSDIILRHVKRQLDHDMNRDVS